MKKRLYLDIKERLKTAVLDENGEAILKHFDLWNKQVQFIEQETPFQTPACFVEFLPFNWRVLGKRGYECDATVRLHLVTEWFSDTASYSPTEEQALEYLDLPDKIVAALHGWRGTTTNSFFRTLSETNHDHDRYVDSVEEFKFLLRDESAVKAFVPAEAELEISVF